MQDLERKECDLAGPWIDQNKHLLHSHQTPDPEEEDNPEGVTVIKSIESCTLRNTVLQFISQQWCVIVSAA